MGMRRHQPQRRICGDRRCVAAAATRPAVAMTRPWQGSFVLCSDSQEAVVRPPSVGAVREPRQVHLADESLLGSSAQCTGSARVGRRRLLALVCGGYLRCQLGSSSARTPTPISCISLSFQSEMT